VSDDVALRSKGLPFERYPGNGRTLLGRVSGDNCRHGCGLSFMRQAGQAKCAYCGIDLVSAYENWLTVALDHVVPLSTCRAWGLPEDWGEDHSNRVLCCTACNTFGNRYIPKGFQRPSTLEEFYDLRDAIFLDRRRSILERHKQERAFFNKKPWESR
jgi:hypothetical protein